MTGGGNSIGSNGPGKPASTVYSPPTHSTPALALSAFFVTTLISATLITSPSSTSQCATDNSRHHTTHTAATARQPPRHLLDHGDSGHRQGNDGVTTRADRAGDPESTAGTEAAAAAATNAKHLETKEGAESDHPPRHRL